MTDNAPLRLPPEIATAVTAAAAWRGLSFEQYVHQVLTIASGLDADLAQSLKAAEDDLAAGRFYTQEQVEAMFKVRREHRSAA